jgi:hypothetical protein
MSTDQLEQRLAAVEQALADMRQQVDALTTDVQPKKWWERIGREMTPEQEEAFREMVEFGRYFRKTGKEPPPEWKPGDPIPEPEFEP